MPEAHEKAWVDQAKVELRAIFERRQSSGLVEAVVRPCDSDETKSPPQGYKRVSFIRHGEGHHNVAQREWKATLGKPGEPYTLDNDPEYKYMDPVLTSRGEEQARELRPRAGALSDVQMIIVSPLRRAMQTALLAFSAAVDRGLPVVAHELCHEHAGKHTCDKRCATKDLSEEFPKVDFTQHMAGEEDPYWGDGLVRESHESIADRGGKFVRWLMDCPHDCIVVAGHSSWLITFFNSVVAVEQSADASPDLKEWFATGEMRTVYLKSIDPQAKCAKTNKD